MAFLSLFLGAGGSVCLSCGDLSGRRRHTHRRVALEWEPQRQKGAKLKEKHDEAVVAWGKGFLFAKGLKDVRGRFGRGCCLVSLAVCLWTCTTSRRIELTLTDVLRVYTHTYTCGMDALPQAQNAALLEAVKAAKEKKRVEEVSHHQGQT